MITYHQLVTKNKYTVSSCSRLINHCFISLNSLASAKSIHARLIKIGFNRHTFLGNRLIQLYSHFTAITSFLRAFYDVPEKNTFTWNILLTACSKSGQLDLAHTLFEEMPERDVVSWNSMISGYISNGFIEKASELIFRMRELGVRASGFTYSIAVSCVFSPHQAKQIHGSVIRSGLDSFNVVLFNSLIDMYGKFGLLDYACNVFDTMEEPDIVSWNSMISIYERAGQTNLALECFKSMWGDKFFADQFSVSIVINICSSMKDLDMGEQAFALCFKLGYLPNSIVSSAVIDMYSKCGRLHNSIRLFEEFSSWDSAVCNSMISAYARNGAAEEAQRIFVLALREECKPTEFTFASILSSISCFVSIDQGKQIHSLILKSGSDTDTIVASALMDMYTKLGSIESATRIFSGMASKDLVSWNTMITGLAESGRGEEALKYFENLPEEDILPDRITLAGVLSACSIEGFINEGKRIFWLMEEKYQIKRGVEHYACMVDMLGRAGRLKEAKDIIESSMPNKSSALLWSLLLEACRIHGNLKIAGVVAEKVLKLEPQSSAPYLVLAQMYGTRGRWESMARVWRAMKEKGVKKVIGCSSIGIRNHVFVFKADQILSYGGEDVYSVLRLLAWEMEEKAGKRKANA